MATALVELATRDAEGLLDSIWAEVNGDPRALPVDPFLISRELGIAVYSVRMKPSEAGRIIKDTDETVILLNSEDTGARARFTCAHELGHYVRRGGDEAFSYVDYRNELSGAGTNEEERYANAFAAALLMPRDLITQLHDELPIVLLARRFAVSPESMKYRLDNLGLNRP